MLDNDDCAPGLLHDVGDVVLHGTHVLIPVAVPVTREIGHPWIDGGENRSGFRDVRAQRIPVIRLMPTHGGSRPLEVRLCKTRNAMARGTAGGGTTNSAPDPTAYRDVCVWSVSAYPVLGMAQAHARAARDVKTGVRYPPRCTFRTPRGGAGHPDHAAQAGRGTAGKRLDDG